jgi:glucosamine-6-phosphate deaminase
VIRRELTDRIDIRTEAVQGPDGNAADLTCECDRYEAAIAAAGGVDLQLLGIGSDGHLAFNEPGSSLTSRTRVKTLTERTRADNARFFDAPEQVPRHVLTQGLGTILDSRHLVLVATGEAKAAAVAAAVEGPLTASCPASVLQWHRHVTVLLDPAAAAGLAGREHYLEVWRGKPDWQGI